MSPNIQPSVLWREGAFLSAQHLRTFARELTSRIHRGDATGKMGSYGLLQLSLEAEKLANDTFSVERVEVVLRDGTLVSVPDNASLPQRNFAEAFTGQELVVHIGVPAPQTNVPQIGGADRARRYDVELREVYDENRRDEIESVEVRLLQARLFFGDEKTDGYECVPLARLVRKGHPEPVTVLDPLWVAPLLRVGASEALVARLRGLAERMRAQARDLASRLPPVAKMAEAGARVDWTAVLKLSSVNQGLATMSQLAAAPDMHPGELYIWLCRIVGDLALFGEDAVMPELPAWDPESPNECLDVTCTAISALLTAEVVTPYDVDQFRSDPEKDGFYDLRIPDDWVGANGSFYLGVEMEGTPDTVSEAVMNGVRLVPSGDVERVLQGVVPGINLAPQRMPPLAFPKRDGLTYFRIETEGASRESWLRAIEGRSAVLIAALPGVSDPRFSLFVELTS